MNTMLVLGTREAAESGLHGIHDPFALLTMVELTRHCVRSEEMGEPLLDSFRSVRIKIRAEYGFAGWVKPGHRAMAHSEYFTLKL